MKKELATLSEKHPRIKQWAHTFECPSPSLSPAHCHTMMDEMKELQEVGAAIHRDIPPGIAKGSFLFLALRWLKKQSEEALTHLVTFQEGRMSPDEKELLTLNLHEIALAIEHITRSITFKQPPTGCRGEQDVHAPALPKELTTHREKVPSVEQWVCTFGLSSRHLSLAQCQNALRVLEDLQTVFTTLEPALEKHPERATALREARQHRTNALTQLVSYQAVCESPQKENLYQRRLLTIHLEEIVLAMQKIPVSAPRKQQRTYLSVVSNSEV